MRFFAYISAIPPPTGPFFREDVLLELPPSPFMRDDGGALLVVHRHPACHDGSAFQRYALIAVSGMFVRLHGKVLLAAFSPSATSSTRSFAGLVYSIAP